MTVGASVEPYVRLTTQSNAAAARSTNAGLTLAPPVEIRRSDVVRSGVAPAAMRSMKNVGGPIMNVTRSRSISVSAARGSHRSINTTRIPAAAGNSTPFSVPDTWARGAGISTTS